MNWGCARIVPGLLALFLAGCADVVREERARFLDAPAMERTLAASGPPSHSDEAAWPDEQWWRAFRDAELDRVVDKALRDNQELETAGRTLKEAAALVDIAGARLLPDMRATLGMRQSRIPEHGVVASYNPSLGGLEKTMASISPLALAWELDFWGKNRALLDAAIGEAAAREAEWRHVRLVLTAGVTRAYLRGHAAARQLETASALTKKRAELVALAEARYRSGLEALDGVQAARADLETARRRETSTGALLALQRDALARLMGEGPDAGRDLYAGRKAPSPARPPLPRSLPIGLLVRRPDLSATLRRAEAAAQRIHAAKAMFLPSIDLAVGGGAEGSSTTSKVGRLASYLFAPAAIGYAVTPELRLPVFQGGRLTGALEAQRADYDRAVAVYNETLLRAAQQVADSIAELKRARSETDAQDRLLRAARARLELSLTRLRDGMKDRREMVAAEVDVLEAAFVRAQLEGDRLAAAVDLYQALGGGFVDDPAHAGPKPDPEADPITPAVEAIQSLGAG